MFNDDDFDDDLNDFGDDLVGGALEGAGDDLPEVAEGADLPAEAESLDKIDLDGPRPSDSWEPDAAYIRAATAIIRRGWDEREHLIRAGKDPDAVVEVRRASGRRAREAIHAD
jgi:hypothetical protein